MQLESSNTLDVRKFLRFELGGVPYALDLEAVQEIERKLELTRLPEVPPEVDGVVDWRGKAIPLLNLWHRMGVTPPEDERDRPVVILDMKGDYVSFAVETMPELCTLREDQILPPPEGAGGRGAELVANMGRFDDGSLVLILDTSALATAAGQLGF